MTYSPPQKLSADTAPVFGTLVIEPEVSGQNNWTKVSPIPWYQLVLQTTFAACLGNFAIRESARSFYSTCTHVSAFLSTIG